MAYGSYSSVVVGSAGPADYEAMSRPVGDRLFFAGEATSTRCALVCTDILAGNQHGRQLVTGAGVLSSVCCAVERKVAALPVAAGRYPATMHGAFATGMREAANVMAALAEARGEGVRRPAVWLISVASSIMQPTVAGLLC